MPFFGGQLFPLPPLVSSLPPFPRAFVDVLPPQLPSLSFSLQIFLSSFSPSSQPFQQLFIFLPPLPIGAFIIFHVLLIFLILTSVDAVCVPPLLLLLTVCGVPPPPTAYGALQLLTAISELPRVVFIFQLGRLIQLTIFHVLIFCAPHQLFFFVPPLVSLPLPTQPSHALASDVPPQLQQLIFASPPLRVSVSPTQHGAPLPELVLLYLIRAIPGFSSKFLMLFVLLQLLLSQFHVIYQLPLALICAFLAVIDVFFILRLLFQLYV
jgi:hypothetical protein